MLMQEATPEMLVQWKSVWQHYKDKLQPNRKTGAELAAYITAKYPLRELNDKRAAQVVIGNVLDNECNAEKLPDGAKPSPVTFIVENTGNGERLYAEQDEIFAGTEIFVGIDFASGWYGVEGSSLLWDELCAFQGLDAKDIENYFCVSQYIAALERFGMQT